MKVSSTRSPSAEQVTWNLESHWSGTLCSKAPKFSKHLTLARLPLMICKLRSGCELLRKALEQLPASLAVLPCFPALFSTLYTENPRHGWLILALWPRWRQKQNQEICQQLLALWTWLYGSSAARAHLTYHHMETAFQRLEKTDSKAHPWGPNSGRLGGASWLY